jgi:hypothetical protein
MRLRLLGLCLRTGGSPEPKFSLIRLLLAQGRRVCCTGRGGVHFLYSVSSLSGDSCSGRVGAGTLFRPSRFFPSLDVPPHDQGGWISYCFLKPAELGEECRAGGSTGVGRPLRPWGLRRQSILDYAAPHVF